MNKLLLGDAVCLIRDTFRLHILDKHGMYCFSSFDPKMCQLQACAIAKTLFVLTKIAPICCDKCVQRPPVNRYMA